MQNGIFKLDLASIGESVLSAVIFAVVAAAVTVVSTHGFDVFATDWTLVGHNMVNLGLIAGVITLGNDILSTNSGSLLGVGPTSTPTVQG